MASFSQKSFAKGEVAPVLYGRADVAAYETALRTCRNMLVMRAGGATKRPGTEFITEVTDFFGDPSLVRLIKFVFNVSDTTLLVFVDRALRFVQDGGVVLDGVTPYVIDSPYVQEDLSGLNYAQSGDVLTLVHPNYPPYELIRLGATNWTLTPIVFGPSIAPPTFVVIAGGISPTVKTTDYMVTAVTESGEESLGAQSNVISATPTEEFPVVLSAFGGPTAASYNVYRRDAQAGAYGFVGSGEAPSGVIVFYDYGVVPDFARQPPIDRVGLFASADNYPSVVTYYQQRLVFANTNNEPDTFWTSRVGHYHNFTISVPLQDDDSIKGRLSSDEVNEIRHAVSLGRLVFGTEGSEWFAEGDQNGVLVPSAVNPRTVSYNGANHLRPVKADNRLLYVQTMGAVVRELVSSLQNQGGYVVEGADLTVYSTHLFDGFTIVDWDWQQMPIYVVWAARNDGKMLALTYLPDQQLVAWSRHDTQGVVENVCSIPEHGIDRVYLVVRRMLNNNVSKRYLERMVSPNLPDAPQPGDRVGFADCSLVYDGMDAGAEDGAYSGGTMVLTGGSTWAAGETLTLGTGIPVFVDPEDVGSTIVLHDAAGIAVTFTIDAITSPLIATGTTDVVVPLSLRSTIATSWDRPVQVVTGLGHLEGLPVAVYADGAVLANPLNPNLDTMTVSGGRLDLGDTYETVIIGLPYISTLETLDVETGQGPSMKATKMNPTRVGVLLNESRAPWAGRAVPPDATPTLNLREARLVTNTDYGDAINEYIEVNLRSSWDRNGRVCIQSIDPVPLTVMAIVPSGYISAPR